MGQAPSVVVLGSSSSAPEAFSLLSMDTILVPKATADREADDEAAENWHMNGSTSPESSLPPLMSEHGNLAAPPPSAAPAPVTSVPPPLTSHPLPAVDLTSGMADLFMSFTSPLVSIWQAIAAIYCSGRLASYSLSVHNLRQVNIAELLISTTGQINGIGGGIPVMPPPRRTTAVEVREDLTGDRL